MRKKSLAAWAAAVLAVGALTGCSSQSTGDKAEETTKAEASQEAAEESTQAEQTAFMEDADLVIAGGDPAGMAAAIQAVAEGTDPAKILVLGSSEKTLSGSYMNASDTEEQSDAGIEDTVDSYIADTLAAGGGKGNEEMAEHLGEESRAALDWVRDLGVELSGVTQKEGSSAARSYEAAGGEELGSQIQTKLQEKFDSLNVTVAEDAELSKVLYGADGEVTGVQVKDAGKEQELTCRSLIVTDSAYLELLGELGVSYVTDESGKNTGLNVDSCANAVTPDDGEIPGLYAAGDAIETALHGDKALEGNELTGVVVFGTTAGTEASIYAQDNAPQQ